MEGTNSIYITSDAIIDYPLSLCLYFLDHKDEYMYELPSFLDKNKFDLNLMKFKRMYWIDYIGDLIVQKEDKPFARVLIDGMISKIVHKDLFGSNYKYIVFTDTVKRFINGSNLFGGGNLISKTIKPLDGIGIKEEIKFLQETFENINIDTTPPEEVQTDKYGRFIFGYYKEAIRYNFNAPRSIVFMNYRENMDPNNINRLHPEAVIQLGDIHDLRVMEAYDKKEN